MIKIVHIKGDSEGNYRPFFVPLDRNTRFDRCMAKRHGGALVGAR